MIENDLGKNAKCSFSTHPRIEDLDSVVIGIRDNDVVVLSDADFPGIPEFALGLTLASNSPDKLALSGEHAKPVVSAVNHIHES